MKARQLIEAETPGGALKAGFGVGPRYICDDDAQTQWMRSGNPDYHDHWQAMWAAPFMIEHRARIRGCPLGTSIITGYAGRWAAINDLVNRTNRESHTNFAIRLPER